MAKTRTEKIDSLQTEIAQLESKRKQFIQEQKQQERNDRTKRLCWRMGLFESLLPDTITLTDDLFKSFLEKAVLIDQSRRILDGLTAQNTAATAPIRASAAAQSATMLTAKPAERSATMAIYHCSIKITSRGKGKSAVAAAAYRATEKITNEYDGVIHDYTRKDGV